MATMSCGGMSRWYISSWVGEWNWLCPKKNLNQIGYARNPYSQPRGENLQRVLFSCCYKKIHVAVYGGY
jgi:hypothetical protein